MLAIEMLPAGHGDALVIEYGQGTSRHRLLIDAGTHHSWKEVGGSWDRSALNPSGTGPWKIERVAPRERIEFSRNTKYWEAARIPRCDRLVVVPMESASLAGGITQAMELLREVGPETGPRRGPDIFAIGEVFVGLVLYVMGDHLHFIYHRWMSPTELPPVPLDVW